MAVNLLLGANLTHPALRAPLRGGDSSEILEAEVLQLNSVPFGVGCIHGLQFWQISQTGLVGRNAPLTIPDSSEAQN